MTILALSIGVAFLAFAVSRLGPPASTRKTENVIDESLYEGVNGTFLRK